ncbi:MAG: DUF1700 domain-containing protein [Bacillota bacterium]|nr:DUF1700 domain-containing protein [Bacillota bacterium]
MNKQEFIVSLRRELKKLPPEEIVSATEYFEEYFNEVIESGEKTEEDIIKEFGNPKRVAAQIKADYAARILDGDESVAGNAKAPNKISAVWWVIIGICSAPVSIPIAIAVFWFIIGIVGIVLGIYLTIIGGACMGLFMLGMGIISIGSSLSAASFFIGFGFILISMMAAAGLGAFVGTKALIKVMGRGVRKLQKNRRAKKGVH